MRPSVIPWTWYSNPELCPLENDRIFKHAWQYVGHAGEVAATGTHFTSSAGEIPIVVARDREGTLRAFLNVCRHRGFPVAQGNGRRETLQCAYHAWTYELDGSLRSAPRSDRERDFPREDLGLVPVQIDAWGPLLFVNPDRAAAPLRETLGPLPDQVRELGLDLDSLRFHHRTAFELAANWKIACENFLECYHCAVAHPSFSALVDVSPDAYRLETSGHTSSQFGPTKRAPEGELERSQFHFIWPNTGVNIFPGHPNLSIGPILPRGPERTARFLDYFFAPEVEDGWIQRLMRLDDQVGREDTVLVEGVQRGIRSGIVDRGQLLAESEQLIAHFQELTAAALADSLVSEAEKG